jgi:hypothetical protein
VPGWLRFATLIGIFQPMRTSTRCLRRLMAPTRSVGFPVIGRWFAPLAESEMTRFLAATASPACGWCGVGPKPMPPTLCAFLGWESLHRAATGSDTLCRPLVRRRAFHHPSPLAWMHRMTHPCECHWARAARDAHLLEHARRSTQDACDWLDLALRRGGPPRGT